MIGHAQRLLHRWPRPVLLVALAFGIATLRPALTSVAHRHAGGDHRHTHVGTPAGTRPVHPRADTTGPGLRHAAAADLHAHLVQQGVTAGVTATPALAPTVATLALPAAPLPAVPARVRAAALARGPPVFSVGL